MVVDNTERKYEMEIEINKLMRVVETAKQKANGNSRWINAIDKAVEGLTGTWIVTELADCLLITTESGETYRANGVCQCKAYEFGQACKHRAAARLVEMMHKEEAPAASPSPSVSPMHEWTYQQRVKVENLTAGIKLRGESCEVRADGQDVVIEGAGKSRRVDRKGKVTWDEMANAQIVKPQPAPVYAEGWSI